MKTLSTQIPVIPDATDRTLIAICGGDVRQAAFQASEQTLRMLASLESESYRLGIRMEYDPLGRNFQGRTQLHLGLSAVDESAMETLRRIVFSGPLSGIYSNAGVNSVTEWTPGLDWSAFSCTEVIRFEDGREPDPDRMTENEDIPSLYYLIRPFVAREDNDFMLLDRLLSKFEVPVIVEVFVSPVDISELREVHYEYIIQMMQVNQVGDDLNTATAGMESGPWDRVRGKVRDPIADTVLREHEDVHESLIERHLNFSIRCWAPRADYARLVASTLAESCFEEGQYRLIDVPESMLESTRTLSSSLDPMNVDVETAQVWSRLPSREHGLFAFHEFSRTASVEELKSIFRLPVGPPRGVPQTFRRRTDPKPMGDVVSILLGDDSEVSSSAPRTFGEDLSDTYSNYSVAQPEMRLPLQLLKKHMFIAGVPGSGKTTAMFNILAQLHYHQIPFLVIEPAKTEYRTLLMLGSHTDETIKSLAQVLQVYSIGNEEHSPFRFNPLAFPDGISVDEHIGAILACFEAAMPLDGPLKGLLAEAVEAVYESPRPGQRFPRLRDLFDKAKEMASEKGYVGEVQSTLTAALDVRLGALVRRSLGKVFDTEAGFPQGVDLFMSPVILEMDALPAEQKCLMSLFVLTAMREHIRVTRRSGMGLAHVTLLEEAHNIVGRSGSSGGEYGNDPKAVAAEYVAGMLAELRAQGEGIIVADQLPSTVAPAVIKNTGTKLAHRLVAEDDREELGSTMLLDDTGMEEIARLSPGEAFLYNEGLYRPRRIQGLATHMYLAVPPPEGGGDKKLPESPSNEELHGLLEGREWWKVAKERRERERCNRALFNIEEVMSHGQQLLAAASENLQKIQDIIGRTSSRVTRRMTVQEGERLMRYARDIKQRKMQFINLTASLDTWRVDSNDEVARKAFEASFFAEEEVFPEVSYVLDLLLLHHS